MQTFSTSSIKLIIWLLIISPVFFSACKSSPYNKAQQSEINNLIGQKLVFPNELVLYSLDEQKEFSNVFFNRNKSFRMVSYIDASCGTCIAELSKWDSLINDQSNHNLEYVLILKAYDNFELLKFATQEVNYRNLNTVIFDKGDFFSQKNTIPSDKQLQSYLLNNQDEIIGVGNPAFSEEIMNSYIKLMND